MGKHGGGGGLRARLAEEMARSPVRKWLIVLGLLMFAIGGPPVLAVRSSSGIGFFLSGRVAARARCRGPSGRAVDPTVGPRALLTGIIVHGQDIRRPLGLSRTFDPARQLAVLECLCGLRPARGIFQRRVKARRETTDLDWSSGDGPVIRGPAEAIMLALTGRLASVAELLLR